MKKKVVLTQDDLKLGSKGLMEKYGISSRGHACYIIKKGYFWENYLQVEQSLSPDWVKINLEEIKRSVKRAVWFKVGQKGILDHRLFKYYKEDLFQEGVLYVIKRAGEIQSGKSKLINLAETGVDHAVRKIFYYGDGAHTVSKFDFLDNEEVEEVSIDELFSQVREGITSYLGEKIWEELWSWALSSKSKCPNKLVNILREVEI